MFELFAIAPEPNIVTVLKFILFNKNSIAK